MRDLLEGLAPVETHMVAIMLADESQRPSLIAGAEPYVELLERFPHHTSSRLSLGRFYDQTGKREQARLHWEHCGFPDFQAAVLSRDKDYARLDALRQTWPDQGNARLNSILVDFGRQPEDQLVERFEAFVETVLPLRGKGSLGLSVAALQVPLRLRNYDRARKLARWLEDHRESQGTPPEVQHLELPLTLILGGVEADKRLRKELTSGSSTRAMIAHYWNGHVLLGKGKTAEAKEAFEQCAKTVPLYTYHYWAECLATRLEEQPSWPYGFVQE